MDSVTKTDSRFKLLKTFHIDKLNCFIFLLSTWDHVDRFDHENQVDIPRSITVNSIEVKTLTEEDYELAVDERLVQARVFNSKSIENE